MTLECYRQKVDKLASQHSLAVQQVEQEEAALSRSKGAVEATEEAQRIVQAIAQTLQQQAHQKIAEVVSRCLSAVFEQPYEFRIRFDRKRGKTEARMEFVRDGLVLDDPLNSVGGGVVDVCGLALRLACVLLARPPHRRFLCLDEPFRFVRGKGNRERTRRMLQGIAEELGVQFLICTDIPAYRLGKVIEIGGE